MNLAEKMLAKTKEVTNKDKLDIIFNEFILPKIEQAVGRKQTEISYNTFHGNGDAGNKKVKELFPKIGNMQTLVETEMKPYLEELGFKVCICSPNYYVYIRW